MRDRLLEDRPSLFEGVIGDVERRCYAEDVTAERDAKAKIERDLKDLPGDLRRRSLCLQIGDELDGMQETDPAKKKEDRKSNASRLGRA